MDNINKVIYDSILLNVHNLWECNDLADNSDHFLVKATVLQDGFVCVRNKLIVLVDDNLQQMLPLRLASELQHKYLYDFSLAPQ